MSKLDKNTLPGEEQKQETEALSKGEGKEKKKWKKVLLWVLLSVLILILAVAIAACVAFSVLYNKGKISMSNEEIKVTAPEGVEIIDDGAEVHYKDGKYNFNTNIITMLIIGVDKHDIEEQTVTGRNGQADAVFLLLADTETGEVDVVNISRDSLVNVSVYDSNGNFVRIEKMQLCLSYAYGDSKEKGCRNVISSVSDLMYGIPINSYFSMDLDAVRVLTNTVGGVDVREYNEDLTEPTGRVITVMGKDAELYIRERNVKNLDSNLTRMDRQRAFITSFANKVVSMTKRDISTPVKLYNTLTGYMYTDITADRVTYLAANFLDGVSSMEFHNVPGKVIEGIDKYAEYEVDTEALYEMLLDLFYVKVG